MSNPKADRVRDVARLAGRSARSRSSRFLAEGPQAVREALRRHLSGTPTVHELYATRDFLDHDADLAAQAAQAGVREVSPEVLAAMCDTVTPQGVLAVCDMLDVELDEVLDARPRLVAVLCEVRDPGNAGTILRAADSAGADAVVLTSGCVDLYNPKTVRSTVGSLFHLPVVVGASLDAVLSGLRGNGMSVLAADGYGSEDLDQLQDDAAAARLGVAVGTQAGAETGEAAGVTLLQRPTAWLFGNEAAGLNETALDSAEARVRVPVYGSAESLNVSTAATVCLYASARAQRR